MRVVASACLLLTCACSGGVTGKGSDDQVVVEGFGPHDGAYGERVTVSGQRVLRTDVGVVGVSPDGDRIDIVKTPNRDAIPVTDPKTGKDQPVSATAPLVFRFPFPAEGPLSLVTPSGEIPLATFTPSWTPGRPLRLAGERVLGASTLGAHTAVMVDGPRGIGFVVYGDGEPRFVAASPEVSGIDSRAWLRARDGAIEALVAIADSMTFVTFDGASATSSKYTNITARPDGVGVDADGFVIVARDSSGGFVRLRGAPPEAKTDGAPVPVPSGASDSAYAVAADGTLVYAWGEHAGDVFDDKADFEIAALGPKATAFGPPKQIAYLDDDVKNVSADVRGGVVAISYCAVDSEPLQSPHDLCGVYATASGTDGIELGSQTTYTSMTVNAGAVTTTVCGTDDQVILRAFAPGALPSDSAPTLYPCSGDTLKVHAIVPDGTGGARLVVESAGKLWVASKR